MCYRRQQRTKACCHFLFFLLVSFFGCTCRRWQQAKLLVISLFVITWGISTEYQKMAMTHQAHCHLLVCFLHMLQHKTTMSHIHPHLFFFISYQKTTTTEGSSLFSYVFSIRWKWWRVKGLSLSSLFHFFSSCKKPTTNLGLIVIF
jgi:hypothetical protein